MIIHTKGSEEQSSLADLLGGGTKTASSKANGMFAKLLATLGAATKGESGQNEPAFKAVVDPKKGIVTAADAAKNPHKTETAAPGELQALLKGYEETEEQAVSGELLRTLSNDQVRSLIHRAKEYLRNEIASKAPEYQENGKTLPKSLMGLVHLADKLGLEPQSITLSTLVSENAEKDAIPAELLSQPLLNSKMLPQPAAVLAPKENAGAITQLLLDPKTLPQPAEENASTLTQLLGEIKNASAVPHLKRDMPSKEGSEGQSVSKGGEHPAKTVPHSSVKTPSGDNTELTQTSPQAPKTEEKPSSASPASQTTRADALIALLQGDPEASENTNTGGKENAPETEISKTLATPKADSMEVKAKEAQQSMRHFATELKEAVENYKPPFTRLSMKLNPEKLGEVEVTLIQRGSNVHVNIQSNNAASVAFLAHNATELKAQLAHQGITNATMNFMGGGDNPQGQQQQNPSHNPFRTYQSFEELELNEEQLGALEIIIPHYA